jgi:hypothetical protein
MIACRNAGNFNSGRSIFVAVNCGKRHSDMQILRHGHEWLMYADWFLMPRVPVCAMFEEEPDQRRVR